MAKSDAIFSVNSELRKGARHPIVEFELALASQHHHRDGGREDLGQGREVEHRIELHLARLRHQRAESEGSLEGQIDTDPHHDGGSGDDTALDGVIERLLYFTPSQIWNLRVIIRCEKNTSALRDCSSAQRSEFSGDAGFQDG